MSKLIESAFLCTEANVDIFGGLSVRHLDSQFRQADLADLTLVFRKVPPRGDLSGSVYPLGGSWRLGLIINDESGKQCYSHSTDLFVVENYQVVPLGQVPLKEPGYYTVELFADGDPQCVLDLFLL